MLSKLFSRSPATRKVTVRPIGATFDVGREGTILENALAKGVPFPHDCRVGTCGTCRCKLQQGSVRELIDKAYVLSAEELRDGYILACQSLAKTDLVLELPLATVGPSHSLVDTAAVIVGVRRRTRDIAELEVSLERPMSYTAGQYADVFVPGTESEARSYSFASAPGEAANDRVRFHVRLVPNGVFSGWLFDKAQVGDVLRLRGPYGGFWLRTAKAPILGIAGGSGMAPLKAILERAARDGVQRDALYFFGARRQEDLFCVEEMQAIAGQWKGKFQFVPVLSEEPEGTSWTGERGLVTEAAARILGENLGLHHMYLCGPPAMVDAGIALGKAKGIAAEKIHFDKFLDRSHQAPAASVEQYA
jgi:NAD(P)H-flavin reductase/ferredoxin